MSKKIQKPIVRISVFLILTVLILSKTYYFLRPDCTGFIDNFYKQDKNTVDVLFIGSSNVYSNVSPQILWDEAGIASFVFAGSGQPVWNSYYYLKEAYKTQQPSLVVVDMLNLAAIPDYQDISQTYIHTTGLRSSMNKLEEIMNCSERKNWGALITGWPVIHSRWKEGGRLLKEKEVKFGAIEKGFYPVHLRNFSYDYSYHPEVYPGSDIKMTEKNEKYLRMIIELAQEHGSQVLLLKTPYVLNQNADSAYNQAEQIAAEYGVKALNMNKLDFGFVYTLELQDTQHLNDEGVKRVGEYLVRYLKENYELPDRRNDERYRSWQEYSDRYHNTQWLSPEVQGSETVLETGGIDINYVSARDGITVFQYELDIEDNTYYRITADISSDAVGAVAMDFYSVNDYDNAEQDMSFPLYGENDRTDRTVINSGSNVPDDAVMRIIINLPHDVNIKINSLTVEKLYTGE